MRYLLGGGGGITQDTLRLALCYVFWCSARNTAARSDVQSKHQTRYL